MIDSELVTLVLQSGDAGILIFTLWALFYLLLPAISTMQMEYLKSLAAQEAAHNVEVKDLIAAHKATVDEFMAGQSIRTAVVQELQKEMVQQTQLITGFVTSLHRDRSASNEL